MSKEYLVATDKEEKIKLDSRIVSANWISEMAIGGEEAVLEVGTVFVAEGSKIEIKGASSAGKTPGKITGKIYNNKFVGKLPIPEKIQAGADVWFNVKLPKHGLKMESGTVIPGRPPVYATSIGWDRLAVKRDEIVTIKAQFEGVQDVAEATVVIYEYDPEGHHDKVISFPVEIVNRTLNCQWKFIYRDDTNQIPTQKEMEKYRCDYQNPSYFFVVLIDCFRIGREQESGLMVFRDSIAITRQHGNCTIEKDMQYTITSADGKPVVKTADKKQQIVIDDVSPGAFSILPEKRPESDTVTGSSGVPLFALFPDTSLLIDAHMHIQSSNCCPLPLQWAILADSAGFLLGRPSDDDRKAMNDTAAGLLGGLVAGRLGKIGRLSTDLISRLYRNDLKDEDMKQELCWTIFDEDKIKEYTEEGKVKTMVKQAGEKAGLSSLTATSVSELKEKFDRETSYYFTGLTIERLGIVLLMDLSFGSYWSRLGLPMYLSTSSAMLYINDFVACTCKENTQYRERTVALRESVVTPACRTYRPNGDKQVVTHLFPSFKAGELETDRSDFYMAQYELSRLQNGAVLPVDARPMLTFKQSEAVRLAVTKKVHFVSDAPGEDPSKFEDYQTQIGYSIAATIRYPLSLFAFYHFDPRRHILSDSTTVDTIAEKVLAKHAFFTLQEENVYRGRHDDGFTLRGTVNAELHPELNNPKYLASKLKNSLLLYSDALDALHLYDTAGNGMFWGVKMYPRLGYSPADFYNYPELKKFYKACAEKSIPITAHCSPGGMAIADYFMYERYDENRFLDRKEMQGHYDLADAAKRFDGVVNGSVGKDAPSAWANVLTEVKDLKICLAHFGSSDTWKEAGGFKKADSELAKRGNKNGKKYDKYDKYRDWVKTIAKLVQDNKNVYTDISYFVNDDPSWFFGVGYDREEIARDLAYLIKKYASLKDRVMMGTDWYMIERDKQKGPGDYFRKMFLMLRDVSKEVEFDAWHQFSVVNPLRFLGLIDDAKGSTGPFKIDTDRLESLGGKFGNCLSDMSWAKKYNVGKSIEDVILEFDSMIEVFKQVQIHGGADVKVSGELLILKGD